MSALSGCESEKDSLLAKITTQTSSSHPDGWVVENAELSGMLGTWLRQVTSQSCWANVQLLALEASAFEYFEITSWG